MHCNNSRSVITAMAPILVGLLLVSCDGSVEEPTNKTTSATEIRVDACKSLSAASPAEILGEQTDTGTVIWENHRAGASVSQCEFAAIGSERSVGLMLRYLQGSGPPASRQALIDDTRNSDDMGTGEDAAAALEAGTEVAGIGELAVRYDLFSFNLMVWQGEYQFTVMLNGFGNTKEAESRAVMVAKSVLDGI